MFLLGTFGEHAGKRLIAKGRLNILRWFLEGRKMMGEVNGVCNSTGKSEK